MYIVNFIQSLLRIYKLYRYTKIEVDPGLSDYS